MVISLEKLRNVISSSVAVENLQKYFGDGVYADWKHGGSFFDTLGDPLANKDAIDAEDIVATECLSVHVPGALAVELISGELRGALGKFLSEIDVDLDLGNGDIDRVAAQMFGIDAPADEAWSLLESQDDVGWVIAGKLLARKRPRLIPIWDNVVRCVFDPPRKENAWIWLDSTLRETVPGEDRSFFDLVESQRVRANLSAPVSTLRALDVILWMSHRSHHLKARCPQRLDF